MKKDYWNDNSISLSAKGLLAWLDSHNDRGDILDKEIEKSFRESKIEVARIAVELHRHGYVEVELDTE